MPSEPCWVLVKDVCNCYGLTFDTAKKNIMFGRFPVPTYKVGKNHVIDKDVHAEFFRSKREEGLRALKSTNS